jgi:hypothetical protein
MLSYCNAVRLWVIFFNTSCCIVHIHGRNLTTLLPIVWFLPGHCLECLTTCATLNANMLWTGEMKSLSHQDLLIQWLGNWAAKELKLHLFTDWAVLKHIAALWKVNMCASSTFSIEDLPSFALKDVFVFIHTWSVGPVCPQRPCWVSFIIQSLSLKMAAGIRILVWYICNYAPIYRPAL